MVRIITITGKGGFKRVEGILSRAKQVLPEMSSRAMMRWGKIVVKDLKASARAAGIKPFSGSLYEQGIRYEQQPKGKTGRVLMYKYGLAVDHMRPHFVNVSRRRSRLLAWASQNGSSWIKRKAAQVNAGTRAKFTIYVKPHPFIDRGYRNARPKLRGVLKRAAASAVAAL